MDRAFKPDIERARQLWGQFWKGENKRPLVSIVTYKQGIEPVGHPRYLEGRDGNFQPLVDQMLAWADTREFIGEAMPYFSVEWGPDTFSAFLGAELTFTPEDKPYTSWCRPFVKDWDDTEIRFKPESYWWQLTVAFFRELKRRCGSGILINPPTLVANLDSLAAIRGTENLLTDMMTCPDKVKTALERICDIHDEVLEAYARELEFGVYGSIDVEGTYCEGTHSRPQCDISCAISPGMFREFVMPCLIRETEVQDAAVYHLDGSGAIKHLEALCEIDKIDLISWVPSDGNDRNSDWSGLHKKIDDLGKGQIINDLNFSQIEQICKKFKSRQLIFRASAETKYEAEDFIARLESLYDF